MTTGGPDKAHRDAALFRLALTSMCAAKQQVQGAEDQRPERDQHQFICGEALTQDRDRAGEAGGAPAEQVLWSRGRDHQLTNDQDDAEGPEQLEQLGRLVDAPEQDDLDQCTERRRRARRAGYRARSRRLRSRRQPAGQAAAR